jgi:hypothetical protein
MESEVFQGWHDFLVAEVGASAGLAGLPFVAVSINLSSILKYPHLPIRAIEALTTLLCVRVICSWALVPGQTRFTYGLEIGGTGIVAWIIQTTGLIQTRKSGYEYFPRFLFNLLPPVPYVVAGVMLVLHQPSAIYWIVPGTLLSLVAGVYCAWVLLIEIQR